MQSFERILSTAEEDIEFELRGITVVPWAEFWLNPRRLRGSDFLMRWSQGVWSEQRVIEAVNNTKDFFAIPYGPSGTAPTGDVRAFELYFERLDRAGLGGIKRPDLLIFSNKDKRRIDKLLRDFGGNQELPFIPEKDLQELLSFSILAVECETSLWKSKAMPNYDTPLTPQSRLEGKLGLKKTAVVPTVILKEEDRGPLIGWQDANNIRIHIWHVFFDQAFGLSLDRANELIDKRLIKPTEQTFQAPGGATTRKTIYKVYYHYAYLLGTSIEEPSLDSAYIEDKNGHILPYITFKGGRLAFTQEALVILEELRQ
ncbi:MAG: AccI family restriction endonuclease [Chloroflexi bacterium]|nr:AccI family restriction endonuclease [Chloroflexota bacterium]